MGGVADALRAAAGSGGGGAIGLGGLDDLDGLTETRCGGCGTGAAGGAAAGAGSGSASGGSGVSRNGPVATRWVTRVVMPAGIDGPDGAAATGAAAFADISVGL